MRRTIHVKDCTPPLVHREGRRSGEVLRVDPFNDAISLHVTCEDQAEIDRYWDALSKDSDKPVARG